MDPLGVIRRVAFGLAIAAGLAVPAQAAPALWQISDGDSKVWLFGSVHLLPPGLEWRTEKFDWVLMASSKVYFEADIGPLAQIAVAVRMLAVGFDTGLHPWQDLLTPEQLKTLADAVAPLGLTLDYLGKLPPWMAATIIETQAGGLSAADAQSGVDYRLQGELPKERKAYFETAVGQIDLMDAVPIADQIDLLFATIDEIGAGTGQLDDLIDSWSSGRVEDLVGSISDDPMLRDDAFAKRLLYDRNMNWIPSIETMLADNEENLVVVGAAHLAGDGSVIDLLGRAGFTVKRIQ